MLASAQSATAIQLRTNFRPNAATGLARCAPGTSSCPRRAVTIMASSTAGTAAAAAEPIRLKAKRVTAENFRPFGQLVEAGEDGAVFGPEDAQLVLTNGTPRFYIMRLKARGLQFDRITHHKKVTQCLAAASANEWYLAVAKPSEHGPRVSDLSVFQIPPGVAVKLDMGTWHSGPYFEGRPDMDFFNLELSDTNVTDHTTHIFKKEGLSFVIDKP